MNNPPTETVCKFEQGCHRVVACEPGCAAPAGLVAVPATTTDRDRIAEALYEDEYPGFQWAQAHDEDREQALQRADAVLAVLPAGSEDTTTTRADTLREAADHLAKQADELWAPETTAHTVMHADAAELRRLAAETQPTEAVKLPFVHTDDDGDRLTIGALMASTYDGEAPVVAVAAEQYDGDETATVYVRPERVEQVVTALRAARKTAEALPVAASAGVQTDEETSHG